MARKPDTADDETDPTSRRGILRVSAAKAEAGFRADFVRFQYCFVDFFVAHLADVSREFKGDMQAAVLLGIIGQLSLQAAASVAVTGKPLDEVPPDRRGITTFRLADATGIPRETVRRKLVALERMGWIERQDNFWMVAMVGTKAAVQDELADLTERSIARSARFVASVLPMVSQQDEEMK